jgi:hypothetical protein
LLAKSLVVFIGIGLLSGLAFGIYLIDVKNTNQLIFVEGSSISIITEKFDFKKNDAIKIQIVNSGTTPLTFSDTSYNLKITGLSGMLMYSPIATQMTSTLEPRDQIEFLWNQIKDNGEPVVEGLYKISVSGQDEQKNKVEKSITITIWK